MSVAFVCDMTTSVFLVPAPTFGNGGWGRKPLRGMEGPFGMVLNAVEFR